MIVTKETISNIDRDYYKSVTYLKALLEVISDINDKLHDLGLDYMQIRLEWEDQHSEYSPERVDPCPDYYGTYCLRRMNGHNDRIGENCSLEDIDEILLVLYDFIY